MRKQWLVMLVAVLASFTLWGCGSGGGSGSSAVTDSATLGTDAAGNAFVSSSACIDCHESFSWSADVVEDYLAGKHVVHSSHVSANSDASCLECHDPIGDGAGLEGLIDAANVPEGGLAAVGCENCHGGGGEHFGVGPMPIAKPGIEQCATCHDVIPESHLNYHPEADSIATNFLASRHFTASVRNGALCSKCHTDEGGRLYKDVSTRTQLETLVFAVDSEEPVQCRTCHNPHKAGGLLMEEVEDRGTVVASAEYATCSTCHMSDREDPADNPEWLFHETVYYRVISDTHYDDPATVDMIEGYVVDPTSDRSCRDCHDVHAVMEIRADDDSTSFSNTINDQWAKSPHGGFIGKVKLETAEHYDEVLSLNRTAEQLTAIKDAAVTDAEAAAWTHYDWDAANRQACQRCHTTTGGMNYLNDPAAYDAANNDFSHLEGWAVDADGNVTSSGQNELLYCWGCHANNSGALRNPGAVSLEFTVNDVNPTLPDLGKTNTCVACHLGRGNMESLGTPEDPFDVAPATTATKTHYFNGAATVFAAQVRPGFEYAGLSYDGPVFFAHDAVGLTGESPEAGGGPCVTCHMQTAEGHTFEVVAKNDAGVITALNSTVCIDCHDGQFGAALVTEDTTTAFGTFTVADAAAFLQAEAEGYHEALAILQAALDAQGSFFAASYPYFFVDLDGSGALETSNATGANEITFSNGFLTWANSGHLGAAHNFNYLHHEPGAYAHNRFYAKRLIYDSIDWLDNGALDGSVVIDLLAFPEAAHWLGADETTGATARP